MSVSAGLVTFSVLAILFGTLLVLSTFSTEPNPGENSPIMTVRDRCPFAAHYHRERNHQGLENRLIEPVDRAKSTIRAIESVQRLGGMLRFYRRAAA